ncbi:MAG: metal-dependent hydrolase [Propionibacteriaceae bacterium]|jgi:membrane-bound metal-dependent hydrolase YbcI (DUF457 family)|nr:metal-dependent hydrolase [Propionibacteriaceae bacterium]
MMGRTHAATGAIAAVGVQPLLAHYGLISDDPGTQVVAVLLAAGGALYADLDHHNGTISRTLPPVTTLLARVVSAISGGHRNGTHSLIGILGFTVAGWGVSLLTGWPVGLWLGFTIAIGLTALNVIPSKAVALRIILILAVIGVTTYAGTTWFDPRVIPWMALLGGVAHVFLGDMWTKEGCPLFWPVNKHRFRFASITTDTWVERYLVAWVLFIAAGLILAWRTGFWPQVERVWVTIQDWLTAL